MKLPYTKFVHPIDQKQFSLHVLKCLSVQFVLSVIVVVLLNFKLVNTDWLFGEWNNFYAAWIVNLLMLVFVYDLNKFRARFKDIYPDLELNKIFYFVIGFVPLFFFAMVVFLCVKKSESGQTYPRAFKFRYALPALVPVLALQGMSSHFNFYTASPTSYYLIELVRGTITAGEYKMKPESKDIFADYQNEVSSDLNTAELTILLSKITSNYRGIASGRESYRNSYDVGFRFLNACHRAIEISEDNTLKFSDFSPIHWLHPSGPVEIFMTKTFTQGLSERAAAQLHERCWGILEKLDHHLEAFQYPEEKEYKKELSDLRMKFYRTRAFTKSSLWTHEYYANLAKK